MFKFKFKDVFIYSRSKYNHHIPVDLPWFKPQRRGKTKELTPWLFPHTNIAIVWRKLDKGQGQFPLTNADQNVRYVKRYPKNLPQIQYTFITPNLPLRVPFSLPSLLPSESIAADDVIRGYTDPPNEVPSSPPPNPAALRSWHHASVPQLSPWLPC